MPPKPLSPVRCQGGVTAWIKSAVKALPPLLILLSASKPQKSRALPHSKKALLFFLPSRKHCVASARRVEEVFACDGFDVQAVAAAQQRERAVAHRARILVQVVAEDHALAVRAKVVELAGVLKVNPDLAVDVLHCEAAAIRERQDVVAVVAALLSRVVRHG